MHAFDRRTDGRTDGQTEFPLLYRDCIPCSAVIKLNLNMYLNLIYPKCSQNVAVGRLDQEQVTQKEQVYHLALSDHILVLDAPSD